MVEPNPNRIRKPVLTVIILFSPTNLNRTEPVKIRAAQPETELEVYFKGFQFDAVILYLN